uniref:Peptidase S1 domain-containing protein n=1 Tax=Plectus sambesii TaxID=2011161 RepID=A0A914W7F3_9BILA
MWAAAVFLLCALSLPPLADGVVRPDRRSLNLIHPHRHAFDYFHSHRWPWMVRFEFDGMDRRCGGALIGSNLVLTAAHCVARVSIERIQAIVGEVNRFARTNDTIRSSALEVIVHPHYRVERIPDVSANDFLEIDINDIALVVLATRIPCNNLTKPILLPWDWLHKLTEPENLSILPARDLSTFYRCTVAGWGKMEFG